MGFVLDIILAAVILISLFLGLKQGIVRTAVGFVGGIFALAASAVLSGFAADLFCGMVGQSHAATPLEYNFIRIIAAVVLFVALQLLVFLAGRALDLFFHLPGLNMVNRLLGALFGALKGAVFAVRPAHPGAALPEGGRGTPSPGNAGGVAAVRGSV